MDSEIAHFAFMAFGLPGYLEWIILLVVISLVAISVLVSRHLKEPKTSSESLIASEPQQVAPGLAGHRRRRQYVSESGSFSWFWPSSKGGVAAFTVVLTLSALTVLIDPFLFWINVFVWYAVAVAVRAVYLKLSR